MNHLRVVIATLLIGSATAKGVSNLPRAGSLRSRAALIQEREQILQKTAKEVTAATVAGRLAARLRSRAASNVTITHSGLHERQQGGWRFQRRQRHRWLLQKNESVAANKTEEEPKRRKLGIHILERDDDEGKDIDDEDDDEDTVNSTRLAELKLAKEELATIHDDIDDLRRKLQAFTNKGAFNAKVAADERATSQETGHIGLGKMLGDLAREIRTLGAPDYIDFLEDEIEELEAKGAETEAKIAKLSKPQAEEDSDDVKIEKKEEGEDNEKEEGEEKEGKKKEEKKQWGKNAEKKERRRKSERRSGQTGENPGEIYALSMMGTCVLFAFVFAMARSSNPVIKNYTLCTIDQVVAIFLAVLWYQAIESLLQCFGWEKHHKMLFSVVWSLLVLTVSVILAFSLRKKPVGLAICCGCMAHFASFASMHASEAAQYGVFMVLWHHPLMALIGMACLCIFFALIGGLLWYVKRALMRRDGQSDNNEFIEQTDDLENDFSAMALAFVFSLFIRFCLTGYHPSHGEEKEFDHTHRQRLAMLCYAVIALAIAIGAIVYMNKMRSDRYVVKRVVMFVSAFLSMNVAWAWLLWGEWEFFEHRYSGDPMFGKLCFALVVTLMISVGVIGLAWLPPSEHRSGGKSQELVILTALGLLVAWSWEHVFDHAIELYTEERVHPAPYKVSAAVLLTATVLPTVILYLKPMTLKAQEAMEKK